MSYYFKFKASLVLVWKFFKAALSFLKKILAFLWIVIIKIHIWLVKHNWHLSRNFNHYNPILGATVYKSGKTWNIARHNIHYNGYSTKRAAKAEALEMWLKDKPYNFSSFKTEKQQCQIDQKNLSVQIRPLYSGEAIKRSEELAKIEDCIQESPATDDNPQSKYITSEPLSFCDYDYLIHFESNSSLKYGGIPLCVSSQDISYVKKHGAYYCPSQQSCYWPYEKLDNPDAIIKFFPKIYQMDNKNVLSPNLVPEPLWGENLRKYLSQDDWNFLRTHTYSQSGYRCSICGGKGQKHPVECDEVWEYKDLDSKYGIAILTELRALCSRCHRVNHLGKANADGKYLETITHMAYINYWSLKYAEHIADKSFKLFEKRSKKNWYLGYNTDKNWGPKIKKILKTFFVSEFI